MNGELQLLQGCEWKVHKTYITKKMKELIMDTNGI